MTDPAPANNPEEPAIECGPLSPQEGDEKIPDGTDAGQLLAKITLLCDDTTGVLFFRDDQALYLRVVGPGA
jgi:hypothetical protein